MEQKTTTIIFGRDGRHRHTLMCTVADAERWAEDNEVFRIVVRAGQWAVNHVNSGKVVTSDSGIQPTETMNEAFMQLENKQGE